METGFLLSVLLKPTTIASVVSGMCAPTLLAEFAMLLKSDFLGNPDRRIGTRAFLPFLGLIVDKTLILTLSNNIGSLDN